MPPLLCGACGGMCLLYIWATSSLYCGGMCVFYILGTCFFSHRFWGQMLSVILGEYSCLLWPLIVGNVQSCALYGPVPPRASDYGTCVSFRLWGHVSPLALIHGGHGAVSSSQVISRRVPPLASRRLAVSHLYRTVRLRLLRLQAPAAEHKSARVHCAMNIHI